MRYLTARVTEEFLRNQEFFKEETKGKIRLRINLILQKNISIFKTSDLYLLLEHLFRDGSIKIAESKDTVQDNYIPIMDIEEAINIVRQEIEYHVIKNKLPVWTHGVQIGDDFFIKVFVDNSQLHRSNYFCCMTMFPSFRFLEKDIKRDFSEIKRVSVSGNGFERELNLLVVFKVK